jgi:hypothetical protein
MKVQFGSIVVVRRTMLEVHALDMFLPTLAQATLVLL